MVPGAQGSVDVKHRQPFMWPAIRSEAPGEEGIESLRPLGCTCAGKVRMSAPSFVIAIVCSLCAVRQPVALLRVQPSASVTSSAVSAMTHGSNANSSPGRSLYPRPGHPVFGMCGSWCIVDPTP